MLFLTEAQSTQPDYVALAMVAVFAVIVVIFAIRRKVSGKKAVPVAVAVPAEPAQMAVAPGVAGQMKLNNVDPKTAAMLMAIVAEKTGKPLNELRFISVKEVQ